MPIEFFTIAEAAATGIELAEATKKVHSKAKMLLKYIQDGYLIVTVLGPGGVGKTTLAEYLTDNAEYRNPVYVESATDENFDIGKNILGKYWVAPGQERRIETYWPKIYRAISEGKVRTIINVVSYGYHSVDTRISYRELKDYYKDGMTKEDFFAVYLERRRQEELKIINELKHRLKDTEGKMNMITLVTKQDLWWHEKNNVYQFYTKGHYNTAILEIEKHKGTANFEHAFISISLLANNFNIGNDVFKLVSEGYDENIRIANINVFVNQLEAYLK